MTYIIRDHDRVKFEKRKERAAKICDYLNELYGVGSFEYLLSDSYYNMKEKIEPHIHLVRNVEKAMKDVGIEPKVTAIRGGTDGARLSYMGLPCPNICTGGHNFHGRFEYIPVQSMEKVVALLNAWWKFTAKQKDIRSQCEHCNPEGLALRVLLF